MERNKPCEVGIALGKELARLTAPAIEAAEHKPCASCAFRAGTYPNGCVTSVADAMKCMLEGHTFHCHHGMKDGVATRVCAGWKAAVADTLARDGRFVEAPWPYSAGGA